MSVTPIDQRQNDAFEEYRQALARVERTQALDDGIAAGRAWRCFLDTFMTTEQRKALDDAAVVTFRRRS